MKGVQIWGVKNNIIMTDRILTRDGTKMIQGLSVLAIVVLHLFDMVLCQDLAQNKMRSSAN